MIIFNFRFYEKKPHPQSLTLRDTAFIFFTESVIITFQFYHYMSVRFFSLTDCLYIAVALQRRMDDSSLVWIHRFQNYRFSGFLYLEGNSSCEVFQSFFTAASVVLCIKLYTNISRFAFVYYKACQIL